MKPPSVLHPGALADKPSDAEQFTHDIRRALYRSKIVAYAQGFDQIAAGSVEQDWNLHPGDLAMIWRGD